MNEKAISKKALEKIKKAKARIAFQQHPIFGATLLTLKLDEDSAIATMATNGTGLKYNPEFVNELPQSELEFVLVHEAGHICWLHPFRLKGRDAYLANVAMDYAINNILDKIPDLSTPDCALVNHDYDGLPWERIYGKLVKEQKEQQGQKEQKEQKGSSQDSNRSNNQDNNQSDGQNNNNQEQNDQEQNNRQQASQNDQEQKSEAGNGTGNGAEKDKLKEKWNIGGVEQAEGNESKQKEQEQHVVQVIKQASIVTKNFGNYAGSEEIKELIEDILAPQTDLAQKLRDVITQTDQHLGRYDYSMVRPNLRYGSTGLYIPGMVDSSLRDVVIALDTSGSIDDEQFKRFQAIISDVADELIDQFWFLQCDAQVQEVREYEKSDLPLRLKLRGGGGTNFRPVFKWVEEQGINPPALIYFTDLWGTFPDVAPDYPVLWVCWDESQRIRDRRGKQVPFGEVTWFI